MTRTRTAPAFRTPGVRKAAACCAGLLLAATVLAAPTASAAPVGHDAKGLDAWWYDAMRLSQAHDESTGKGVKIAVIDEAIDPKAPELRGAHVTLGKDCKGERVKPASGTKADHGTAVTTLISGTGHGTGPGGLGIRGVAPDADVTFYATDTDPGDAFVDCDTSVYTADLMSLALRGHPDIISTSLGLGYTPPMRKVLARAIAQGVVVVAATGDRTRPSVKGFPMEFPAARPGVVAVNAGDKNGRAWVNNPPPVHSFIDGNPVITAPGVDVTNIRYVEGRGWVSGQPRTGTSDATPIVAGALALVKSKYPEATGNQLIQQLIHNASGKYAWDRYYGFGLVSVTKLLAQDPTRWPDTNPLLNGPRRALRDFPMSAYGAQPSASSSPTGATTTDGPAADPSDTPTRQAANTEDGGVPVWVWPLGAVLLLGAVGAGFAANTRGSRRGTGGRNEERG
ncbi:MAG TPA: S8 family serine peptidase [Nocardioidaceae bacterium]|nr:S8 family serine peptidase [Nocardioidaceae bacterium]